MPSVDEILRRMRNNPRDVRFDLVVKVCDEYFGTHTQRGSHLVWRVPQAGSPRINLQRTGNGKAKPYQVRQVLRIVDGEGGEHGTIQGS